MPRRVELLTAVLLPLKQFLFWPRHMTLRSRIHDLMRVSAASIIKHSEIYEIWCLTPSVKKLSDGLEAQLKRSAVLLDPSMQLHSTNTHAASSMYISCTMSAFRTRPPAIRSKETIFVERLSAHTENFMLSRKHVLACTCFQVLKSALMMMACRQFFFL